MGSQILTFCEKYKEKLNNDKKLAEDNSNDTFYYTHRISFSIQLYEWFPNETIRIDRGRLELFDLDDEDLQYLYNKYSKRANDEMNAEINAIKAKYGSLQGKSSLDVEFLSKDY